MEAQVSRFRLLHLSDPHFSAFPNCYGLPKALRKLRKGEAKPLLAASKKLSWFSSFDSTAYGLLLRHISDLHSAEPFDLIVVSGDVGTTGRILDQKAAYGRLFTRTPSSMEALADLDLGIPILVMPGNHDRYGGRPVFAPSFSAEFDKVFGNEWRVCQSAQLMDVRQLENGRHVIIAGADFSIPANDPRSCQRWPICGNGLASQQVVSDLEDLTRHAQLRFPDSVVIWCVHFPPETGPHLPSSMQGTPSGLELIDGDVLMQAAGRLDVYAVLCGHYHKSCNYLSPHGPRVMIAGTMCQHAAGFGHWAHALSLDVGPSQVKGRISDSTHDPRNGNAAWRASGIRHL